jgi:cytochrome c peroxidase
MLGRLPGRSIAKKTAVLLALASLLARPGFAGEASADQMTALKKDYKRPASVLFAPDNPYSDAKYNLGKIIFFDPRLSDSKVMSCATCHNPGLNWSDGLPKGVGNLHQQLGRKTMSLLNLAWDDLYFWDGRADSLEHQAPMVFEIPKVMNMTFALVLERIKAIPGYKPLFEAAFPGAADPYTRDNIGKALAIFERKIVSGQAPFDRWIEGDDGAISDEAKHGFVLFNTKANCTACHAGWNFSDGSFHDTGLPDQDPGRGKFLPGMTLMQHAFKTVGLRNIAARPPYMHDGSLKTLDDVIAFYDHGFVDRPSRASEIKPLHLSDDEKKALAAFLATLTSTDDAVAMPMLPQ